MEDDAPAGPVRGDLELALVDAGRVRARGSRAAGPRTASGRWCSAACPSCRPSSRRSGRPPRPNRGPGSRWASGGAGSASGHRAGAAPRGRRCAWAVGRSPSARGGSRVRSQERLSRTLRQTGQHDHARSRDAPSDRPRPAVRRAVGGPRRRSRGATAARSSGCSDPNGAGKTTTVRLLTALIEPTEGTASVDGFDVRETPDEVRARVGILTETPGLYDKLSATRQPRLLRAAVRPGRRDPRRADRALPAALRRCGTGATTWPARSARA